MEIPSVSFSSYSGSCASVHGFLAVKGGTQFMICNPTTHQLIKLCGHHSGFLGYDPVGDQHKVISLRRVRNQEHLEHEEEEEEDGGTFEAPPCRIARHQLEYASMVSSTTELVQEPLVRSIIQLLCVSMLDPTHRNFIRDFPGNLLSISDSTSRGIGSTALLVLLSSSSSSALNHIAGNLVTVVAISFFIKRDRI